MMDGTGTAWAMERDDCEGSGMTAAGIEAWKGETRSGSTRSARARCRTAAAARTGLSAAPHDGREAA